MPTFITALSMIAKTTWEQLKSQINGLMDKEVMIYIYRI